MSIDLSDSCTDNVRTGGVSMSQAASGRFEMRVKPDVEGRIRVAADLEQTSVSAFLTSAALERADRVIAEHTRWQVSASYFDALVAALDAPPKRNAALAAAAAEANLRIKRR